MKGRKKKVIFKREAYSLIAECINAAEKISKEKEMDSKKDDAGVKK